MKKLSLLFLLSIFLLGCNNSNKQVPGKDIYFVNYDESSDYIVNGLEKDYKFNDLVSFSITLLNEDKEIDEVKVDNTTLTSDIDGIYSFNMPSYNVHIFITLSDVILPTYYHVYYVSNPDYEVTGLKEIGYLVDELVTFSIEVTNASKEIDTVKVHETTLTPIEGVYSFNMLEEDIYLDIGLKSVKPIDTYISYSIKYTMSGSTSYAFKDNEGDLIKATFVTTSESNIINEVSSFTKIYGGGYGSGTNKWNKGDMLKFGTTSVNGELTLSLSRSVNKATLYGYVGNTSCKLRVGPSSSTDWSSESGDHKTQLQTLSNFIVANKDTVEEDKVSDITYEFDSTNSIKIGTTNNKVFYLTGVEFYFGETKTYTVTWVDDNGNVLEVDTDVVEGSIPTYDGDTPKKEGYEFVGWTPEVGKIYEDTTYTALFTKEGEKYKVTWLDYDGSVIKIDENVSSGTIPSYIGEEPSREETSSYKYYFIGWTPKLMPTYSDMTYTARYYEKNKSTVVPGIDVYLSDNKQYVYYGLYPQSHVKDTQLISNIENTNPINESGWYFYNDNFYYKAVSHVYNGESYTFTDGDNIVNETSYWFRCDPIKWNVISSSNNQYSLIADTLLDSHYYHHNYDTNDYYSSDIRTWLTSSFYSLAFYFNDASLSNVTLEDNHIEKIYLPSYSEMNSSLAKTAVTTDYARALGAWSNKNNYYGSYWTRTASTDFYYAAWNVNSGGVLSEYAIDSDSHCIRPCITVNI